MTLKKLLLLSLTGVTLTGCRESLVQTLLETRIARAELPFEMFDGATFAVAGDALVLLATTNSGKLLEIDVDAGTVRQLGQSQAFQGFKPGWTGITINSSETVFTSSRTRDDTRDDGCAPSSG